MSFCFLFGVISLCRVLSSVFVYAQMLPGLFIYFRFITEVISGGRFHCSCIVVMINKSKGVLWRRGKQEFRFMGKKTF